MARRYSPEVKKYIAENVSGRTTKELVALVNVRFNLDFTEARMRSYKKNHNLKSGTSCGSPPGRATKLYPAKIMDFINKNYKGVGHKQMAALLNSTFGANYTVQQMKSYYGNRKLDSGVTGCFEKGHVPANKGKKGWCAPGSEKTRFKKGQTPPNKTKVGTVRLRCDGYLWEKYGDGGLDWKPKHQLLWEREKGPVPKGHVVTFLDGDKSNVTLDNLVLITMAESLALTRANLRSSDPEVTKTGILIAKVKTTASRLKKAHKKDIAG